MFHRVEKRFEGAGLVRVPGEAMDPDAHRNGRLLVQQRVLSPGPIAHEPTACPCGRLWVAEVEPHDCQSEAANANKGGRPRKAS